MKKEDIRRMSYLAMMTALEIVLSRFLSINAWNLKIGFSFVPVVAAAMMFGPISAVIVAALGDFLGAILFPSGPFFMDYHFIWHALSAPAGNADDSVRGFGSRAVSWNCID